METATRTSIYAFCESTWGDVPDYPFHEETTSVLRHPINQKWYALVWSVARRHVGLEGDDLVDIMNIKVDPLIAAPMYRKSGFMPAYHMNKEKWMTILLDGSVAMADVIPLLEMSHALTDTKPRKKRKAENQRTN